MSANTTLNRELLECLLRDLKGAEPAPATIHGGIAGLLFIVATGVFAVCVVIPPPIFRRRLANMTDDPTSEKHETTQLPALLQEDKNKK